MPLAPYFAAWVRDIRPGEWGRPVLPAGVRVEELQIPGPHGPVPVRAYRPGGEPRATLVWAHGGGFRHGDLDMPEAHMVAAELAARAGAYVISVGYRLAVDGVRYPVPLDDVVAAWSWASGNDGRIAIGGASAGAALALAAAMRARDGGLHPPDALLLAYPFVHFPNPAPDAATAALLAELPDEARITNEVVEDMVRNYVGRLSDLPPGAMPGTARLDGLPPAYVLHAEYDDLRPSGELLERQLRERGVPVTGHLAPGVPHGHLNHVVDLPAIEDSLEFFAAALR